MRYLTPPKWLRKKAEKNEPLTQEQSDWLKKRKLATKSKEDLVQIIMDLRNNSCKKRK